MDRTIIAPLEQMRDFDFVSFEHDTLVGLSALALDVLSRSTGTIVAGFTATQTALPSLTINLGAGRIYQFAAADATSSGSISADPTIILQQGQNPGQTVALIAPSSGLSQWNLIQAQFSQVDAIRANDPNGGIVPFYNASNPAQPLPQSINTVRQGLCVLQVITGAAAVTGSQVPPLPSSGWVPLYLISVAGGQTTIVTSQILTAGPSVGTGVPANYPVAPFLAGFQASHHNGNPGQAPKIDLTSEVRGVLPYVNMAPVRTLLNANLVLYVNPNTGSDTNTGLSPTIAFRTVQAAVNTIYQNYDFNGFFPTINLANGTYTSPVVLSGVVPGIGAQVVRIIGNVATPSSVLIQTTSACFTGIAGAQFNVSGVTLASSGVGSPANGVGLRSLNGSDITFNVVVFSACAVYHMIADAGGQLNLFVGGTYTISGSSTTHYTADASSLVNIPSGVVVLTGTPAFSSAFAFSQRGGLINATGSTYSGAATGPRYLVAQNGVITTLSGGSATFFPGSSAGSATTGGQYS